ncbi:amino acid adenylation domain-containing protein [Tumebacillus sp. BK434]|uniref:amino acid adenylation domain-containing protein n=1 Tax=Tumebacillus sp. BK434 TaxID=2512169 RepID=UPI0010463FE5|nr:non-ribosomal peptide synthetase [Tumebacillus sp. BK434]TCP54509.1 amino acid adenylation domain-containing protein [Tumebacillus sp. BK434]
MSIKQDLTTRKSNLSAEKRALLEKRLKGQLSVPAKQAIPKRSGHGPADLSLGQQRLWFFHQFQPEDASDNIPYAVRLYGKLDVQAMQQAISEVVKRHEALRTNVQLVDDLPKQVISPELHVPLPVLDLTAAPAAKREAVIDEHSRAEARKPFDLARDPLIRCTLLHLGEADFALLLTLHHLIADGWSMELIMREVAMSYHALAQGKQPGLPAPDVQFADYAQWQLEQLSGEVWQKQLGYWKERLGGQLPVLQLPTDRPRPAVMTTNGSLLHFTFPLALQTRLQAICAEEQVTLFMLLLAAYQTLLYRYSGQEELLVGTAVAGRNRAELENTVGNFVNTLVLRAELGDGLTFREFLQQVKTTALGAFAHQEVPFEKVIEEVQPERNMGHTPLFQVLFLLQPYVDSATLDLGELRFAPLWADQGAVKYDQMLWLSETETGLRGMLSYNTDLFDRATIERTVAHLETLLTSIADDPAQQLSELNLLPAAEAVQVLTAWNDTRVLYAEDDLCTHHLFERQAERTPDAAALVFHQEIYTYRELNERANQVAHRLRELGVGANVPVGLCLHRSAEMIVGLLAILKAGGPYLPLDPAYPKDRLTFMLEDAQAPVILTQQSLVDDLPPHAAELVLLDDLSAFDSYSTANPQATVTPLDLAFLLYTSGSTGRPKGVAMGHRALCNLHLWQLNDFEYGGPRRTTMFYSINFDAAFQEVFSTLASGGTLYVLDEATRRDSHKLLRYLADEKIERAFMAFIAMQHLAEAAETSTAMPQLRELVTAGEQLQITRHIVSWLSGMAGVVVYNQYGPTESHVVTSYTLQDDPARWPALPSIGKPIANAEIYVLDKRLRPVPVGVHGELYIGGTPLADGYLGRPDLTEERFIQHPFRSEPGARLYKSGDLCRWLPDGTLEYIGRADHQVKIRGFRVELGEVEAVVRQHPQVREAAVIAVDKRLVAYIVPEAAPVPYADVKGWLLERLPDYMVPTFAMFLATMPLTPSGKINRLGLPAPDWSQLDETTYVAPRTAAEASVAQIWSEVLRVPNVGMQDNFFDLGGHSLLATQVISRLNRAFGAEIPLRELFENPTPAGVAAWIETRGTAAPEELILPQPDAPQLLSFAQNRLWLLDRLMPASTAYSLSSAIRMQGALDVERLRIALSGVVERHQSLRANFRERNGEAELVIRGAAEQELPVYDLTDLPAAAREQEAERLIRAEAERPFDLEKDALLRTVLLRLGPAEHVCVLTMHHIITDGWSNQLLVDELCALYAGEALPELPLQYHDYARWQHEWMSSGGIEEQLAYWKQALGGDLPVLELPADRPRPAMRSGHGATYRIALPGAIAEGLRQAAWREQGITLHMVLLAAFNVLLHRYTGQTDLLVGTPIAGRNRSEFERLIGLFVNTLVVRTDLSGAPTFGELLTRVKQAALDAYTHPDVPFEKLVEELQPKRSMSHTPLFQVLFSMQNMPQSTASFAGITAESIVLDTGGSKCDLSLYVAEQEHGLDAHFEYATDLFDDATIARMAEHYTLLLQALTAAPDAPVGEVPFLPPAERARLLGEFNDTAQAFRQEVCLHQFFEEQAARQPQATALVDGEDRLTYRELNERANAVAHRLQQMGVGPETLVGVYMERRAELLIGLLGVLKAGGAYVPLDPNYPQERVLYTMEDAKLAVLLTAEHLHAGLPDTGVPALYLPLADAGRQENPAASAQANHLAYIIYTSGSTGRPKGVAIEHRSAATMVQWALAEYEAQDWQGVLFSTSICFDLSVYEIFATLAAGGKVILAENALYLPELPAQNEVTLLNTVPSAIAELLRMNAVPAGVRTVNLAGEALPLHLVQQLYALGTVENVYNLYGPSEDTTYSTYARIDKQAETAPLIGRPLANTQGYVLDQHLHLVPIGVPGQLYLSGDGLARGYLGQAELTAEKFIPHPFAGDPAARMYATGDAVRWLADGNLEYLGRIDRQIKVRGFRIEQGEIEAALLTHPLVQAAYVQVREDSAGDKRLVAYVAQGGHDLTASGLRAQLKDRLPEYMIPSAFVLLDKLPLTPNGKVDSSSLPAPVLSLVRERAYIAPRNETEATLAHIWQELLSTGDVGAGDNFFELGGHSLLAVRLLARIEAAFGKMLPMSALFHSPTVEALAEELLQGGTAGNGRLVPLQPQGTQTPLFLVHPIGGSVFCYRSLAAALGPDQPTYALQAPGLFAGEELPGSVEALAEQYVAEIRTVQAHGPYRLGGWSFGGVIALEMARRLQAAGEAVEQLVLFDSYAELLQKDAEESVLLAAFFTDSAGLAGADVSAFAAEAATLSEADLPRLLPQAKQSGLLPADVSVEQLLRLYRVFRANRLAYAAYQAAPYQGDVLLLHAADSASVSGWQQVVQGTLYAEAVQGDHFTLLQPPNVLHIAQALQTALGVKGEA